MSCQKCEEEPMRGAFFRWKNANIEIVACKEHWLEITDILNRRNELEIFREKMKPRNLKEE